MFDKVKETLIEILDVTEEEVLLESHLYDDLYADSLDMAQIILNLENYYGISFQDDITQIKTVSDIVNYIKTVVNKK